jgi:hypothetical protein
VVVTLVPLMVAVAVYVSVPFDVALEDLTVKFTTPPLVFCGDVVDWVVLLPVPLKATERPLVVARLLFASTVLTVPTDVDEASDTMLFGAKLQASIDAPSGVNTRFVVTEVIVPAVNVTVHVVAKFDMNTYRE